VPLFRPAVVRRMREGKPPVFPPSARDAIILGGTIFDLLDREIGRSAAEMLATRPGRGGLEASIEIAFDAPLREVERAWREHLRDLTDRRQSTPSSEVPELRLG
jgi:hypothetical protein